MNVEWDMEPLVAQATARVAAASLPIFRSVVGDRFPLALDGDAIVAPYRGLVSEYGDGREPSRPWIFSGAEAVKERFGGDH